tara:strand:- start:878 stop:1177 length:300 start_codon:yes stop_codon:yes gene_type:complete
VSFFDTKSVLSIFVELSLIVIIVNLGQLLPVTYGARVEILHYILLLDWNAIFQIDDEILVLKVIEFVIQALDHIVSDHIGFIWFCLIATPLGIGSKVPG